ncbi:group II intron reverse transcriptase/maturase [Streptomyces sp. NPDC093064]|uniref:group II intron reverse transcriptase/maturase n=1 Tax=unclassified Streptomyces TaxID=2593676 RepID=UPI0035DD0505
MDELKAPGKPFDISKWSVWEAYEKVKANKGAPGVDAVSLGEFEKDLKNNLYKIWNRLSSGTYFPPPVRAVEIPKKGGVRILGVPTVGDRIAQTVVAGVLEGKAEPVFHPDSYGYRPGRSAIDAVGRCRERCWKADWVIDLDIRAFFDSVPWDRVLKAVAAHADRSQSWVVLYVKRWLQAPLQLPDGTLRERDRGTPQGSAVSPVLANLFLHYAFDAWMARTFPAVTFERYVDDAVVHCVSERQARYVLAAIRKRMAEVGLELHPEKTRIVYCQDDNRRGSYGHAEFTFLGYTFRRRSASRKDGGMFLSFIPAISREALSRISTEVRSWRLHHRTSLTEADLARKINPIVRGWVNYYGAFYKSALFPLLERINAYLMRWMRKKFKRLRGRKKAQDAWNQAVARRPRFFAHWAWTTHVPRVW